jgi:hypothetical protein
MRLRLRVPSDGEQKSSGLRGWFQRLFSGGPSTVAAIPPPVPPPIPKPDIRWQSRGSARYFPKGRLCTLSGGLWIAEYIFAVEIPGQPAQLVRIVLPETPVSAWERRHNARLSEAGRLRIVLNTLESLIDLERLPESMHVPAAEIEAVQPPPAA